MGKHSKPHPPLVEDVELPEDVVFATLKREIPEAGSEEYYLTLSDSVVDDLIRNGWRPRREVTHATLDLSEYDVPMKAPQVSE